MEEFLPAILVAVAVTISVVKNMKKINEQTPQQQQPSTTWGEVFPTLESTEEPSPEPVFVPAAEPVKRFEIKKPKEKNRLEEIRTRRASTPTTPTQTAIGAPMSESAPQEKKQRIKLNTKSEAKRAFIYSEILTRKY